MVFTDLQIEFLKHLKPPLMHHVSVRGFKEVNHPTVL